MNDIRHLLSVDFEEHFQLVTSGRGVPERHWDRFPSRIVDNTERVLRLLDRHDTKATFFVGDWVAERYGALIADIALEGHEIACRLSPSRRRAGLAFADPSLHAVQFKRRLESVAGRAVHGCRIDRPARAVPSGVGSGASPFRYECRPGPALGPLRVTTRAASDGTPVQLGMPSLRIAGQDVPLVGGESLRHVPGALENRLLAGWARSRAPHHFTFKLWELDPDLARLAVLSSVQRLICYRNHHLFEERFARLLERAAFSPVRAHLGLAEEKVARTAPLAPVSAPPAEPEVPGVPVSIIVPCFNEEAGLSYLANVFSALDAELGRRHRLSFVLVDDGSTDRTRQEMQRLFGHDGRYRIVRHEMNRGIAAAILTGIGAAKDDIVVTMDSDCSYDPARIEDMLALLAPDVALVTASPYHADAGVEGVPGWRIFVSRGASSLYRMVLRTQLATYTSCFRVYRKRALEGLILHHEGFIGVAEMLARLDMAGGRIAEYPVVLEARVLGRSKLRLFRTIVGHLRLLGAIFATRLRDRRRAGAIALTKEEG